MGCKIAFQFKKDLFRLDAYNTAVLPAVATDATAVEGKSRMMSQQI